MIFLSYSWKEQTTARAIDLWLRDHGFVVWIDFRELDLAADIQRQLDVAVGACSLFIAAQPADGDPSPWMTAEILMARRHFKPILQIVGADVRRLKRMVLLRNGLAATPMRSAESVAS
jgi:hypothetical protein